VIIRRVETEIGEESKSMNDDEKDNSLDAPESVGSDSSPPVDNDSFSVAETETDEQEELARKIEVETGATPAIRNPAHLTLAEGGDDDPPDWPGF
jgi:hypothetical protein